MAFFATTSLYARLLHRADETTEKGGAGSRGGRVIGYTKTRHKAVYAGKLARAYASFNQVDHREAGDVHQEEAKGAHEEMHRAARMEAKGYESNRAEASRAKAQHHVDMAIAHDRLSAGSGD